MARQEGTQQRRVYTPVVLHPPRDDRVDRAGQFAEGVIDPPVQPPAADFPADLLQGLLADRGQERRRHDRPRGLNHPTQAQSPNATVVRPGLGLTSTQLLPRAPSSGGNQDRNCHARSVTSTPRSYPVVPRRLDRIPQTPGGHRIPPRATPRRTVRRGLRRRHGHQCRPRPSEPGGRPHLPSSVVDGGRNCAGGDRGGNAAAAAVVLVFPVQPALTRQHEPAQRPAASVDLTRDNDAGHEQIPAAFGLVNETGLVTGGEPKPALVPTVLRDPVAVCSTWYRPWPPFTLAPRRWALRRWHWMKTRGVVPQRARAPCDTGWPG